MYNKYKIITYIVCIVIQIELIIWPEKKDLALIVYYRISAINRISYYWIFKCTVQ